MSVERFDLPTIQAALTTQVFGRHLVVLPRTGSTNQVLKELASRGAAEGTVVVTDEQTAGRGRLGRRWLAPPGTCLLCSILFRPRLSAAQATRLTMLCSLAAADAVCQVAGLQVALKWPNDLIVESSVPGPPFRKLAGVLTESGVTGERVAFAVVGIGINVNVERALLDDLAPDATSVLAETGQPASRADLLAAVLARVEVRYQSLQTGESPHEEWAARLATLGRPVKVTAGEHTLSGVAEAVDEDGALLLRTRDGGLQRLTAADVTLAHD